MPLPGGPSDKIGNRYEQWWTVSQFVQIINGQAESIRIEDPTIEKAEFVLTTGDGREFHQAKRSHLRGKWSLSELGSPKHQLLQTMFKQLSTSTNTRFIFVSGSDAPLLISEVTNRYLKDTRRKLIQDPPISRSSTQELLMELVKELKNAGFDVDANLAF